MALPSNLSLIGVRNPVGVTTGHGGVTTVPYYKVPKDSCEILGQNTYTAN